jgi:cholesterol transport system auxiliary component
MMARIRVMRLLSIAALALLGACTLMPQREPIHLYALPASPLDATAPSDAASVDATLRLATPQAGGLLDSARIVVIPEPHRPSVYQGARWADAAPVLIRNRLLDAFQEDGRVSRLVHTDAPLPADLELFSDLRAFQSEYVDGLPQAVVRLEVRLVDAQSQRLLASRRFTQRQAADTTDIPDVVDAFGLATDRLARELVDWTLDQLPSPP